MPIFQGQDLVRDTDYTVHDVNLLVSSGAVPKELLTFCNDGSTVVSGLVIDVMKLAPKAKLGEDWLQSLGSLLHWWAREQKQRGEPVEPQPSLPRNGEPVHERYLDTKSLSLLTGMKEAHLKRLLHWVKTEHRGLLQHFILDDPQEGYMVHQGLVMEFKKQNRRFDKFLKAVVAGRAILARSQS